MRPLRGVQDTRWWEEFIFDRSAHIAVTSALIGIVFTGKIFSRHPTDWLGYMYNRVPNAVWATLFIASAVIPAIFFDHLQNLYLAKERRRHAEDLGVALSDLTQPSAYQRTALALKPFFGFTGWFSLNFLLSLLNMWSLNVLGITILVWGGAQAFLAAVEREAKK